MEKKKSSKADLEGKRTSFFLVGLVIALGVTLVAFEWRSRPAKTQSLGLLQTVEVEEEIIPITRENEIKPPPPPPPPKVVEVLDIVADDVLIEDELQMDETEADENTIINVAPVIETADEEVEDQIFFNIIEEPAEFPGGDRALLNYLNSHVNYPVIAQENGIEGKVYLKFVIDEQGNVTNAQIARGVDSSLDAEALRVINSLPRFKPGKQRGRPVKVYYSSVINFKLQ